MPMPLIILEKAEGYLRSVSDAQFAKIRAALMSLAGREFKKVYVKQLKGLLRELVVQQDRIIFFEKLDKIFVVSAFRKKTAKTPPREIENAEKLYTLIN